MDQFVPINGNMVKFYICGPTVYDSAHMGHARAYLSFDIVRRVLMDYFNYDVLYVMNVTDIDDKIIKRARQIYLFDQYAEFTSSNDFKNLQDDISDAIKHFQAKIANETDAERKHQFSQQLDHIASMLRNYQHEQSIQLSSSDQKNEELMKLARDVLSEWLDHSKGHSITELDVFSKLAKRYENEFLCDMKALNVLEPSILTRVSEYVPEIIEYIQTIIANGYGYVAKDGSVYFDTNAFTKGHKYAKLMPEAYCNAENSKSALRESEGELSVTDESQREKRSPCDFALWKRSKSGEPKWASPWGDGRPGWHIECSAMSSAICGDQLDIHAGGFDLKFPHHDNEIAQCEAYFDTDHWVNFFLHCGPLRIAGLKMSKSLKNFITIRETLEKYTARQIRILFLMHTWTEVLDYSPLTMEHVLSFEKSCNEFFLTVKDYVRKRNDAIGVEFSDHYKKCGSDEHELLRNFSTVKADIHDALCDSINTHDVIEKVRILISKANVYIKEKVEKNEALHVNLLVSVAEYLTWLFKVFGVIPGSQHIGFPSEAAGDLSDREEIVMPYLKALVDFREQVRASARTEKNIGILKECDRIRDEILPELGVRLEDAVGETTVKLDDPVKIKLEQEQKRQLIEAKKAEKALKEKKKQEQEKKKQEKQKQSKGKEAA